MDANNQIDGGDQVRITIDSASNNLFCDQPGQVERLLNDNAEKCLKGFLPKQGTSTGDVILPQGTRLILEKKNLLIPVYEFKPRVWQFAWTPPENEKESRIVNIALPYIILISPLLRNRTGWVDSRYHAIFFRTKPLCSLEDELALAILPNCLQDRDITFMCLGYLESETYAEAFGVSVEEACKALYGYTSASTMACMKAIIKMFGENGFNYDIRGDIYKTCGPKIDGIYPVKNWVKSTELDPTFVLRTKWPTVGTTIGSCLKSLERKIHEQYPPDVAESLLAKAANYIHIYGSKR